MAYQYHTSRRITPSRARALMQGDPAAVILDVRTKQEYDKEHIPGAMLIPDYALQSQAPRALPNKSAQIFVYCQGGSRSQGAAGQLASMGYTNVYDIGGINSWPYERE